MKFRGPTAVLKFLTLVTFMSVSLMAGSASAGRMKELHFDHLEAIAQYLFGNTDTDSLVIRKTDFVPAPPGFFIAIASGVQVYSVEQNLFLWETCTTFFTKKSGAASRPKELLVAKVSCTAT